jgi:hypothetical protein
MYSSSSPGPRQFIGSINVRDWRRSYRVLSLGKPFGDTMDLIVISLPQQISLVSHPLHIVEPIPTLPLIQGAVTLVIGSLSRLRSHPTIHDRRYHVSR